MGTVQAFLLGFDFVKSMCQNHLMKYCSFVTHSWTPAISKMPIQNWPGSMCLSGLFQITHLCWRHHAMWIYTNCTSVCHAGDQCEIWVWRSKFMARKQSSVGLNILCVTWLSWLPYLLTPSQGYFLVDSVGVLYGSLLDFHHRELIFLVITLNNSGSDMNHTVMMMILKWVCTEITDQWYIRCISDLI